MLTNKHGVKAAYFKLICLWRYSQICEDTVNCIICINTLVLWHPWTMQWYASISKFFGGELKYKDLLYLQRNRNGSHTSYGQPFNWKSTSLSFLTKLLSHLLYCQVILQSMSACSFETGSIPFHNTLLRLLCTSIDCNRPSNRHLQYIKSTYLLKINCPLWLQC